MSDLGSKEENQLMNKYVESYWQHSETGRVCACEVRPGNRWFEISRKAYEQASHPLTSVSAETTGMRITIDLQTIPTSELVAELSRREGVERVDVAPHTQTAEICVQEAGEFVYDKMEEGPLVILKISD